MRSRRSSTRRSIATTSIGSSSGRLADNERAIHVYEKCGFVVDGRLPERSWKGGAWVDRVVMSVTREALRGVVHRR